jgi:hypothetical protein
LLDFSPANVVAVSEVAHLDVVDRALHRAASCVSEDHDRFGTGHRASELYASQQVVVHHVARDASVERVADAHVKEDLARRARVDAAQDHGSGILSTSSGSLLTQVVVGQHLSGSGNARSPS